MNNYANYYNCIAFWNNKHKCEESNIINNSQEKSDQSTIYCESSSTNTIINKCCFLKNNAIGSGLYLFRVVSSSSTMEVRDCTIENGYSISGAVSTSYRNKEIKENNKVLINYVEALNNGFFLLSNFGEIKCSDWDIVLLHKIHIIWTILKYIKLVCYNIIFVKYTTTMCHICIILCNYIRYI
jgi:hypothetical protein